MRLKDGRGTGHPRPNEVWNANLYFDDMSGAKNRPVIVLEKRDDEFTVLMVTSHPRHPDTDMKLIDPYEVMLDMSSTVRTDRLFRIPEGRFNYKLGDLCDEDADAIGEVFGRLRESRAYRRKAYRWRTASRRPGASSPPPRASCAWTSGS